MIGRLLALARDNQWGTSLIYQNVIDFVNNGKVEFALNHLVKGSHHVVTQIIEAKFVIRPIGDVCQVCCTTLWSLWVDSIDQYTNCQPQECIDLSHPFSITTCEIVVDCYYMHALPC